MYISTNNKGIKVIKKEIGKSELGRPIYRDMFEVTCPECDRVFEQPITFEPDMTVKIMCKFCNK